MAILKNRETMSAKGIFHYNLEDVNIFYITCYAPQIFRILDKEARRAFFLLCQIHM